MRERTEGCSSRIIKCDILPRTLLNPDNLGDRTLAVVFPKVLQWLFNIGDPGVAKYTGCTTHAPPIVSPCQIPTPNQISNLNLMSNTKPSPNHNPKLKRNCKNSGMTIFCRYQARNYCCQSECRIVS